MDHKIFRFSRAIQFLTICLAVLLAGTSAFPQASAGNITGTITDQSGGAIAGATVTITDVERGTNRNLVTDDAGAYSAPNLVPGTYTVRVEYKGFRGVQRQNVVLEVGKEIRVDLSLQPGEQTQTITVTEALPMVEVTNATLGGTLQPGVIADLPLNGRNFMNLLQLRPGVTVYVGGGAWTQSTNGLRPEHNVYILDGITAMEPLGSQSTINSVSLAGDAATLLPIDTIQEFNTQQNPKAEFGWKPGSITNVALKSGTNAFHGTANAFGRTDSLDATNSYLAGATGPDGKPLKQAISLQEYGATLGGPIKKDKVFFFMGYEGQRYTVGNPSSFQFPYLSSTSGLTDTANNLVAACNSVRTSVGAANLSPTSLKIAGLDNNCARTSGYSIFALDPSIYSRDPNNPINISGSLNTNFGVDNGLGKIDFHMGDKNTVNGKVFIGTDNGLVANSAVITQPFWRPTVNAWTLFMGAQWNYVPSSSVVNTFRFGSNYFHQTFSTSDCTGQANGNPDYGIPFGVGGPTNSQKPNCGFTNITLQGFSGAVGCCSSFPKFYGPDHINEFIENVSVLRGKHAWKFGGEVRLSALSDTGTFNRGRGQVQFRGSAGSRVSGDTALENFFRGYTSSGSGSFGQIFIGEPRRYLSNKAFAAFVQDDFRISPRVILNLGVRYEYITPVSEKYNRLANFDPNLGLQQLGLQTSQMWHGDNNNFAPRLGLAWDIRGNGKTVLRAGGNMIYITPGLWNQVFQQNTKNPTTGLNGNPTGYATCTGLQTQTATCTPGVGNIVSSGIVLRAPALTANTAAGIVTTPINGQVNWNQNAAVYGGNVYPGVTDASSVFKCALDKQCTIQATNQNYKTGYVNSWSLGIQQAITNNMSLQVDYVGNHGTKLVGMEYTNTPLQGAGFCLNPDGTPYNAGQVARVAALNAALGGTGTGCPAPTNAAGVPNTQPSAVAIQASRPLAGQYPYYSFIYTVGNPDFSNYNGAQVTLSQRPTHGLSYTLGFTYAHALDLATSERGGPTNTPGNFRSDYSNSDFDIRKRFTATTTYAIPGREGFAQLMRGWKVTSIITLQSGLPWGTVLPSGGDIAGTGEQADRWNFFGNPADFSGLGKGSVPFFNNTTNPACAAKAREIGSTQTLTTLGCYALGNSIMLPPAIGTYGNLVRNTFRGNTFFGWDASLIKDFKFTERLSGEFRLEVFNVINRTNFGNPQFNGGGNTDPLDTNAGFGRSNNTPDVANNNPALGSGGPREMQLGFRLTF